MATDIVARRPTEPVASRVRAIKDFAGSSPADYACCGVCGQAMRRLTDEWGDDRPVTDTVRGPSPGPIYLSHAWGWRYDGRTWRPTPDHLAQRHRVKEFVRTAATSEGSSAREQLRTGAFFRRGNPGKMRFGGDEASEATRRLPTRVECPDCRTINMVAVPSTSHGDVVESA